MDFLDLSLSDANTVVINFPGRPMTHEIEPLSHLGWHNKYRTVGQKINELGVGFIGCPQRYHHREIIGHTNTCLGQLEEHTRDKMVIIMASSAGAGGVLASPVAQSMANGMVLLNTNPYNIGEELVRAIPGWIDFYHGFEDDACHASWAERIAKEAQGGERTYARIDGQHSLNADQVLDGVLTSLRKRNIIE